MKQYLSAIISAVSVAAAAVCLVQISALESEMKSLENQVANGFSRIEGTVNGISYQVSAALEEQAAVFLTNTWNFLDFDIEAKTVRVECFVTPKEYRPDFTEVSLMYEDQEISMELQNGVYTVAFDVPLFEYSRVTQLFLKDGDTVKTKLLNWGFLPHYDLLPLIHANSYGSSSFSSGNNMVLWNYNSSVEIDIGTRVVGEQDVQSIRILYCIDGEVSETIEIPLDSRSEDGYTEPVYDPDDISFVSYPLERTFEAPFGSTQELYVDVVDCYGLHHVVLLERNVTDEKGTRPDPIHIMHSEANIYDEEGNLLYAVDKSLYE